ncbi:hypothetical protein KJ599_00785 [bacterium]|nr:hypothetical protein [bacterium]
MNAFEYILSKQIQWAYRNNITLIGSKGNRGRKAYTQKLDDNLFEPLLPETVKNFKGADGGELTGNPCKMQAVHSSSALGVNIFQYWKKINQVSAIAAAFRFCSTDNTSSPGINFEIKYPISGKFPRSPNIDVVIKNSPESRFEVFAIECKFSEAYSPGTHSGISPKYIELNKVWDDIPNLLKLAKKISPDDNRFTYLHLAQLVKHILGLKEKFGKNKFRLLYLWYDTIGPESAKHHKEVEEFTKITKADGVYFHAMSYQDLIIKLTKNYRNTHRDYIDYINERYL